MFILPYMCQYRSVYTPAVFVTTCPFWDRPPSWPTCGSDTPLGHYEHIEIYMWGRH